MIVINAPPCAELDGAASQTQRPCHRIAESLLEPDRTVAPSSAPLMAKSTRIFTLDEARESVLEKLRKAAGKGAASLFTAAVKGQKLETYQQAISALEIEGAIFVDRSTAKPKYFLQEFAPSVRTAAQKIETLVASKHPVLLALADFKKVLSALEKALLVEAVQLLQEEKRVVRLIRGKVTVFAHGDSLRAIFEGETAANETISSHIRSAYQEVVAKNGYPDVEIAQLRRATEVSLEELKAWLLQEYRAGRAVFSGGDWSLSDETTRAGAVELHGEQFLLVRLES